MKSFKRMISILLAITMILAVAGCGSETTETDPTKIVIAKINDDTYIYRSDVDKRSEYIATQYAYYFGSDVDTIMADEDMETTIKNTALEQLVEEAVIFEKAKELGLYELTDEEKAAIKTEVDESMDLVREEIRADLQESIDNGEVIDDIDAEVEAQFNERMEASGLTYDEYLEEYYKSKITEKVSAEALKDVDITDEELKEDYDEMLAEQKEAIDADPSSFMTYYDDGIYLYVPEGVTRVYQILMSVSDTVTSAVEEVYSTDKETAFGMMATELAAIKPKAQEALNKAKAGEDFKELMKEYGNDTFFDTEEGLSQGYIIIKDNENTDYYEEFQDAAEALDVGQVSDLVVTPYGYHILYCFEKIEAGERSFDSVKESLYNTELDAKISTEWSDLKDQWIDEANIEYHKEDMFTDLTSDSDETEVSTSPSSSDTTTEE